MAFAYAKYAINKGFVFVYIIWPETWLKTCNNIQVLMNLLLFISRSDNNYQQSHNMTQNSFPQ